ncbi:MAG: hypothetical protein ACYTEQ_07285 [Planctomycetota bacterium]
MGLSNLHIKKGDITNPDCCNQLDRYDYIFSCSVFEHIYPEKGGDVIASKNVCNLLKENGIFTISVPYYKQAFHEYKDGPVYSVEANQSKEIFFQRFYDEKTLYQQIIAPSKLSVVNRQYIGERFYFPRNIHRRLTMAVGRKYRNLLLGRWYFRLSGIFMTTQKRAEDLKKPYLAIVALRK